MARVFRPTLNAFDGRSAITLPEGDGFRVYIAKLPSEIKDGEMHYDDIAYTKSNVEEICDEYDFELTPSVLDGKGAPQKPERRVIWPRKSREEYVSGTYRFDVVEYFSEVKTFLQRFIWLPNDAHMTLLALFVLLSYVRQHFRSLGILHFHGPAGSGKSTVFEVLQAICHIGIQTTEATVASVAHIIHQSQPTLLLDECESLGRDRGDKGLQVILRAGYQANGSRMFGRPGGKVSENLLYGLTALGSINGIRNSALRSRIINVPTARHSANLDDFDESLNYDIIRHLVGQGYTFLMTLGHEVHLTNHRLVKEPGLDNRDLDIFRAYLVLAKLIDSYSRSSLNLYQEVLAIARETASKRISEVLLMDPDAQLVSEVCSYLALRADKVRKEANLHRLWVGEFQGHLKNSGIKIAVNQISIRLYSLGIVKDTGRERMYPMDGSGKTENAQHYCCIDIERLLALKAHYRIKLAFEAGEKPSLGEMSADKKEDLFRIADHYHEHGDSWDRFDREAEEATRERYEFSQSLEDEVESQPLPTQDERILFKETLEDIVDDTSGSDAA